MACGDSDITGVEKKDHLEFVKKLLKQQGRDKTHLAVVSDDYLSDVLFLDVDTPELPEQFWVAWKILTEHELIVGVDRATRSEHGNLHVYVKLTNRMSFIDRILLSAVMGSDPKRELLHYIGRNVKEQTNNIILIEPRLEQEDLWPELLRKWECSPKLESLTT